jgi:hypothetical protein
MKADKAKDKALRFERIAERRVTQTLRLMRLIGNLANKRNYCYTEEQVRQIVETLELEVRHVKGKFKQETSTHPEGFSFRK